MLEKYLSDTQRGIVYMALGFVLLFHTLGLFTTGLSYILVGFSLFMIVGGFLRADMQKKFMDFYHKATKKTPKH